ncbi:MAG: Holliday junction resolvase RuvX [Holosporales bacterium]
MPVIAIVSEFWDLCPSGRLVCLDVGTRTLGVAFSDPTQCIATPFKTLNRTQWKKDGPTLVDLFQKERVQGVVVGWPLHMDGSVGSRCHGTKHFSQNLLALKDYPLIFWDERLSTVSATRLLRDEADLSRQRRAPLVDTVAATLILQSFLSTRASL